jgi:restriction endonuclease Mrr
MKSVEQSDRKRPQIFLSYASSDREVAQRIAEEIQKMGMGVWFSEWELRPGDSIAERIEEGLSASDILLILLSAQSVRSRWVEHELNAALSRELKSRAITIVPVLIEDCEIPAALVGRVNLDLRSNLEQGVRTLVQELDVVSRIDFSQLDFRSFERLVGDLLIALGFSVEFSRQSTDAGFDLKATYQTRDPFGAFKDELWLVQVKLYRRERVSIGSIHEMVGRLMSSPGSSKGLIITNSQLTSVAYAFLGDFSRKSRTEVRIIDGAELRQLLLRHPDLVRLYFGTGLES